MAGNVIDCTIRSLLALAGVGNIVLATATDGNDGGSILIKILVLLCGIITLLLSVLWFILQITPRTEGYYLRKLTTGWKR